MKLLQKTVRWYMLFSILAFVVGGLVLFMTLRWILTDHLDEGLQHTRQTLHLQLVAMDSLPAQIKIMDEVVEIQPLKKFWEHESFRDTALWSIIEREQEPHRKYTYHEYINGKPYRLSLLHSQLESEDLVTTIIITVLLLLGLLLLAINVFNRYLAGQLWQPFYQTIDHIRTFSFALNQPTPKTIKTDIDEFILLRQTLEQMQTKMISDYRSLKQFTENASHETQTPLAIIQSHIELLLQQTQTEEAQIQHLYSIQQSVKKLSKLNQSLLLLTRIENRQYQAVENIAFDQLIQQKITILQPLLEAKSIQLTSDLQPVQLSIHSDLADILLTNLLGNAIKHNTSNGTIHIFLNAEQLSISNTGKPLTVHPEILFERFSKNDDAAQSLGLGLAIVKEIAKFYGFELDYVQQGQEHKINLIFLQKK